jgi:integrase
MRGEPRLKIWRGKYAVVWREGGQTRRQVIDTTDRKIAETGFAAWKHARENVRPEGILTVGRILDLYLEARPLVIPRPKLAAYFGNHLPEHITQKAVDDYAKTRGAAPSTAKTELGLLSTALVYAYKQKWIERPIAFDLPQGSPPRERWITQPEAERLIEAAKMPHIRTFIALAAYTGARAGAILDLTWDRVGTKIDYNVPGRAVTRKRRAVVPIPPQLAVILQEAKSAALSDYVVEFAGDRVKSIKHGFRNAAVRAKLKGVTPHTLRHSFATWMAMGGMPMRKIADALGHTSVAMVESVYAKFSPDHLDDVSRILNSAPAVQKNRNPRGKTRTAGKSKTASKKKPSKNNDRG